MTKEYYSDRLKTGAISITKSILNAASWLFCNARRKDKQVHVEKFVQSCSHVKQFACTVHISFGLSLPVIFQVGIPGNDKRAMLEHTDESEPCQ